MSYLAYVINLRECANRHKHIMRELRTIPFEVVNGINGINPSKKDAQLLNKMALTSKASRTEDACRASHIKVLEKARIDLLTKPVEFIVIFEDDIVVVDEFTQRLVGALERIPPGTEIAYLGYLHYTFSTPVTFLDDLWCHAPHTYASHAYVVPVQAIDQVLKIYRESSTTVDGTMTSKVKNVALRVPIAYQLPSMPSIVTGWPLVSNPFPEHITNPLFYRYIIRESDWPGVASDVTEKVLHILPGQDCPAGLPEGWTTVKWDKFSDIHDFYRYGGLIPFAFWVVFYNGGLAFFNIPSPWVNKHYSPGYKSTTEYVCSPRGDESMKKQILSLLNNHVPIHDKSARWGEADLKPYPLAPVPVRSGI